MTPERAQSSSSLSSYPALSSVGFNLDGHKDPKRTHGYEHFVSTFAAAHKARHAYGNVGRPENIGAAMRFVYCYSMRDDPDAVREVAPKHAAYWHELGLAEYIGGPFADRSGGLISFEAPAEGPAGRMVSNDPFQRAGLINDWWLKIWMPQ